MRKIKITNEKIITLLEASTPDFPKYATQIINLASGNAQATRPQVVGQLSDLIQEFGGKKIEEWAVWYLEKQPHAVENAVNKIVEMIEKFKDVIQQIDKAMIEKWVEDLLLVKTFVGLQFQEAILKTLAKLFDATYRLAEKEDESKNIDGYIGEQAVSIKPKTYEAKKALSEQIAVPIIFYEKIKDGVNIYFDEAIFINAQIKITF